MTNIIKIEAADYGLQESKGKEISDMFKPMVDSMVEYESEFNEIVKLDPSKPETGVKASELLKRYVTVRTDTADIHKKLKNFFLLGGRFVDRWKAEQIQASKSKEDKLKEIKNYKAILDAKEAVLKQESRALIYAKYIEEGEEIKTNLGTMPDEIWFHFIAGKKADFEARREAEKKAEVERLKKIRIEKERQKRIRAENETLRIAAEKAEKQLLVDQQKREAEEKARIEKERIAEEKRIEAARIEREKHEAELQAEREKQAKIEKELQEKREAEEKAVKEAEAAKQAELNKGDVEKVTDLINDLKALKTKYSFDANKNKVMYKSVAGLLEKVIDFVSINNQKELF